MDPCHLTLSTTCLYPNLYVYRKNRGRDFITHKACATCQLSVAWRVYCRVHTGVRPTSGPLLPHLRDTVLLPTLRATVVSGESPDVDVVLTAVVVGRSSELTALATARGVFGLLALRQTTVIALYADVVLGYQTLHIYVYDPLPLNSFDHLPIP